MSISSANLLQGKGEFYQGLYLVRRAEAFDVAFSKRIKTSASARIRITESWSGGRSGCCLLASQSHSQTDDEACDKEDADDDGDDDLLVGEDAGTLGWRLAQLLLPAAVLRVDGLVAGLPQVDFALRGFGQDFFLHF